MALTTLTTDLDYHQAQVDDPVDSGTLTTAQFKALCDQAANDIKNFINDDHIPELDADHIPYLYGGVDSIKSTMEGLTAGVMPDASVTTGKLADGAATFAKGGHGGTTAAGGVYNLINALSGVTPVSADKFPFLDASGSTAGNVTLANLLSALQVAGALRIETGTYVGDGTYGSGNPTSITPSFPPQIAYVMATSGTMTYMLYIGGTVCQLFYRYADCFYPVAGTAAVSTNTLSWYTSASNVQAQTQCNSNGVTYRWIVVG